MGRAGDRAVAMRILAIGSMYPPQHAGGYELLWESAVAALRARGHQVRVLTSDLRLNDRPDTDAEVFRELRRYWDGDAAPELSPLARLRLERENGTIVRRHLTAFQPDLASYWGVGGISMSILEHVRRAGVPGVGYVADHWLTADPPMDQWLRAWSNRPVLAAILTRLTGLPAAGRPGDAATWYFISDALRSEAVLGNWPLPRTGLIHAGIAIQTFALRPARSEWSWKLLYVGRVDPVKGVDTAIRALVELPEDATLTICGPAPSPAYLAQLQQLTRELGLEHRVLMRSAEGREQLWQVYADADALLFPVRWREPWGLVPLEAMAVGVPVLATGTGGSAEYLRDGHNSRLFPPDDPHALAEALQELASNLALRDRLVQEGRRTAEAFTEDAYVNGLIQAHEEAVAGEGDLPRESIHP